jgi:DNA-binding transcriptional regulator YiaG
MDVKSIRNGFRLSQEQFAHKLGVTLGTVNRWEKGKAKPSPLALMRLNELEEQLNASGNNVPVVRP